MSNRDGGGLRPYLVGVSAENRKLAGVEAGDELHVSTSIPTASRSGCDGERRRGPAAPRPPAARFEMLRQGRKR